jgi:hypothetical protein
MYINHVYLVERTFLNLLQNVDLQFNIYLSTDLSINLAMHK